MAAPPPSRPRPPPSWPGHRYHRWQCRSTTRSLRPVTSWGQFRLPFCRRPLPFRSRRTVERGLLPASRRTGSDSNSRAADASVVERSTHVGLFATAVLASAIACLLYSLANSERHLSDLAAG